MSRNAPGSYAPVGLALPVKQLVGHGPEKRLPFVFIAPAKGGVMVARPSRHCPQCNGSGMPRSGETATICVYCGGTGWANRWIHAHFSVNGDISAFHHQRVNTNNSTGLWAALRLRSLLSESPNWSEN
jgi:hypothetical protein